jgi:ubiquinone biosynthesis protein UbiJ
LDATIAIRLSDQPFQLRITGGELNLTRGESQNPDVTLETDQATLLSLLRTDNDLEQMVDSGSLRIVGDRDLVGRFRQLFPLPAPSGLAADA